MVAGSVGLQKSRKEKELVRSLDTGRRNEEATGKCHFHKGFGGS